MFCFLFTMYIKRTCSQLKYHIGGKRPKSLELIYILCFSVCLYPINVQTAEPIGSKFCVGPLMTLGKVYEWSKFQKFASNKTKFSFKLKNPRNCFLFCFVLQCIQSENVHNGNGSEAYYLYTYLFIYISIYLYKRRSSIDQKTNPSFYGVLEVQIWKK